MSEVTRYDKLQLENIQYEKPENQNNIYFGPMYYDLNPLLVQSSRLKVKEIKDDTKQKYLVLETDSNDFRFYDKLVKLDDHNLDQTYQKSEEWFNKELPMDILENMYKRITIPFKKDDIPSIEFKLPFHKQTLQTKIYNSNNELVEIDNLKSGSTVIIMLHIRGLKFLKQNYYCDIFLSQIKLVKEVVKTIKPAMCLIEDDEIKVEESKYDYEIVDEEVVQKNKEISELETKISEYRKKIENDKLELSKLEEKLVNLK